MELVGGASSSTSVWRCLQGRRFTCLETYYRGSEYGIPRALEHGLHAKIRSSSSCEDLVHFCFGLNCWNFVRSLGALLCVLRHV